MDEPPFQSGRSGVRHESHPSDSLRDAVGEVGELKEYAEQLVSARLDLAKLRVRKIVIWSIIGVLGLVTLSVVVGTSVALLLSGLAQGVGSAMGGRQWAGDLLVGGGILVLIGLGAWVGLRMHTKSSLKQTVARYEHKQDQQRRASGHDASERARGG